MKAVLALMVLMASIVAVSAAHAEIPNPGEAIVMLIGEDGLLGSDQLTAMSGSYSANGVAHIMMSSQDGSCFEAIVSGN